MAKLPDNLDEMQRDILQYDLSDNPFLQKSSIAARDKELKTNAKKIIPAINELLRLINTYSSGIQGFMQDTQDSLNEVLDKMSEMDTAIKELKQNDIEADAQIEELGNQYDELDKKMVEIQLDISSMMQVCESKNNNDMEEFNMEFVSKLSLAVKESAVTTLKASDIIDPQKQIKVYAYDQASKKYKYINCDMKQVNGIGTIFEFTVAPIELAIDTDSDADIITVTNRSNWPVILYLFKISK